MPTEVLYVSTLSSRRLLKDIYEKDGKSPFAIQKFSRLIATGFVKNGIKTTALSNPVTSNKNLLAHVPNEVEDGIDYVYIPFLAIPIIKHIIVTAYAFFYVFLWGMKNRRNKVIVCDVIKISVCMGALFASKIIGIESLGVVTDMPGLMVGTDALKKCSLKTRFITWVNKSYISHFSSYVFLTEQMNNSINTRHRPYIIMEGLVDANIADAMSEKVEKASPRTLIYAGGLYARYGLKTLCEAFTQLPHQDVCLMLYGEGAFVKELEDYCKRDKRIRYMGIRPNEEVVREELRATLLINPRPTTEEFTKYSFPSKNMEYMVSGTPLLTTKLPGMPIEYHSYVYLFEDESVEGYAETISHLLALPAKELESKGENGKAFVLKKKNNIKQSKRILNLVEKIIQ